MKLLSLLVLTIYASVSFSQQQPADDLPGPVLPFTFVDIAGPRPVIPFLINGKKATSMIHSNAGSYLQLSPDNAAYFGLTNLIEDGKFGISEPGKINTRYKGQVQKIQMGNIIQNNKDVAVFNKYPADAKGFGMLGRKWIKENRIILGYNNNKVIVQPNKAQQDSVEKQLLAADYIAIPMEFYDQNGSYTVEVTINNQKTKFLVSTVSDLIIDSGYAKAANIETGAVTGRFGGPTGETGYVYGSKEKFTLTIGAFEVKTNGSIEDTYRYSDKKRPDNANDLIGGTLGATFMIAHKAVIDFGTLKLYLKNSSVAKAKDR